MRRLMRRTVAWMLALLCFAGLSAIACADNTRYPSGQYFEMNTNLTKGVTVQVSASKDLAGAEKRRDQMLEKGYDSYIYHEGNYYRVMCGKFHGSEEAKHYRDHICSHTDRSEAYLTNVYLPDWAYTEFEKIYQTDPYNTQGMPYNSWEKATGPYYDGDSASSTKTVYTVQVSSGTNFPREEQHRDELMAQGFDAFVLKRDGSYKTMSGMFSSRSDAEARCSAIKAYTAESDAYVTQADIPTGDVNYRSGVDPAKYYGAYISLLGGYRWAVQHLPDGMAATLVDEEHDGNQLMYVYYLCDLDGNGIEELIIVDSMQPNRQGVWAVFSCDPSGNPYLVAWGYLQGNPVVSACTEKGTMAFQFYNNGTGLCQVYSFADGKIRDAKQNSRASQDYVRVAPAEVDSSYNGYYVDLTPFAVGDLNRLGGDQNGSQGNTGGNTDSGGQTGGNTGGQTEGNTGGQTGGNAGGQTGENTGGQTGGNTGEQIGGGFPDSYSRAGVLEAARAAARNDSHYSTVSEKNMELLVPEDSQFLKQPFRMKANARANGRAIYIMPRPQPGNGTLGTVAHGEEVMIVAENDYYYFFVTRDGRAGWNGKSYFSDP